MPMIWDDKADAKLLVGIIATGTGVNYDALAEFMGAPCTVSAIKHRIARIKEKAEVSVALPRASPSKSSPGRSRDSRGGSRGPNRSPGQKRAFLMKATKATMEKVKSASVTKSAQSEAEVTSEEDLSSA
ncbi:hypothetical protein N7462_008985 [Penicillium macrosclerotiorum]|uniref:uncharacterized protein n=1 Tax=Penicillium macrosclerotiorum TaxID=303699 RepID=UPI00254988E5|nr:uncharacterized protein N7462_008985 [Penicillium macrosclerotiorum]KAJ5676088.1 hypothetical protein N7462_008985 [Penicillium macrosclerotiorum]